MDKSSAANTEINLTQFEIDIITKATDQLLQSEESNLKARQLMERGEKGQLSILKDTLSDFPFIVTEAIWDSLLKANVAERLKNSPSKDTLVSRLKRATMGLTLAMEEPSFAPQSEHTNLKKYAEWVGVKLQNAIDPATGHPRLKSIAKPARAKSAKLPAGQTYWLIGAMDENDNPVVICDHADLDALKDEARRRHGDFKRFWFIISPMPQPLDIEPTVISSEFHQNTAAFFESVSLETI
jgi:hypothetical protein